MKSNAPEQKAELVAERRKLVARIIDIGRDLAALEVYQEIAAAHDADNGGGGEAPAGKGKA